jgi:hypothetical protein
VLPVQLLHHLYADTLEKVSAFKGQHPQFLADLVSNLRMEYFVQGNGTQHVAACHGTQQHLSSCPIAYDAAAAVLHCSARFVTYHHP